MSASTSLDDSPSPQHDRRHHTRTVRETGATPAQWIGEVVQPDAYGTWQEGDATIDFFLEVDRGTETLDRLAAKLDRYADLEHARGETTWVLFAFGSPRREHNARRILGRSSVPVATTTLPDGPPMSEMWLPLGEHEPCRLIELAGVPKSAAALRRATTGGSHAWRYELSDRT